MRVLLPSLLLCAMAAVSPAGQDQAQERASTEGHEATLGARLASLLRELDGRPLYGEALTITDYRPPEAPNPEGRMLLRVGRRWLSLPGKVNTVGMFESNERDIFCLFSISNLQFPIFLSTDYTDYFLPRSSRRTRRNNHS